MWTAWTRYRREASLWRRQLHRKFGEHIVSRRRFHGNILALVSVEGVSRGRRFSRADEVVGQVARSSGTTASRDSGHVSAVVDERNFLVVQLPERIRLSWKLPMLAVDYVLATAPAGRDGETLYHRTPERYPDRESWTRANASCSGNSCGDGSWIRRARRGRPCSRRASLLRDSMRGRWRSNLMTTTIGETAARVDNSSFSCGYWKRCWWENSRVDFNFHEFACLISIDSLDKDIWKRSNWNPLATCDSNSFEYWTWSVIEWMS